MIVYGSLIVIFEPRPSKAVCFSVDGLRVVSGADDATVKLWDLSTEQPITTLRGHEVHVIMNFCTVQSIPSNEGGNLPD